MKPTNENKIPQAVIDAAGEDAKHLLFLGRKQNVDYYVIANHDEETGIPIWYTYKRGKVKEHWSEKINLMDFSPQKYHTS